MKKPQLSICTTIKNRSRLRVEGRELLLFPNCVRSLVDSIGDTDCELIVADWESDDWPLVEWLHEAAKPMPVRIFTLQGTFSRGRGLNAAAQIAEGNTLFFLDSDVLVPPAVISLGLEHCRKGRSFFPILYSFDDPTHSTGRWCDGGYGHCIISKNACLQIGGWPEYRSWGREDKEFWSRVCTFVEVDRHRVPEFYHQWHPQEINWKNRYGEMSDAVLAEQERQEETLKAQAALAELASVLPQEVPYILVDEDRIGASNLTKARAIPFLERGGCYWGSPPDDATAISELERLHRGGVRFIAFAWIAFWWLEYYSGFHSYLRSKATCVLENERLVVFDLNKSTAQ